MEQPLFYLSSERLNLIDILIAEQFIIAPHERVGDGHDLAEHLFRRFGNADAVAERLTHLLNAVQSFKQRHRHNNLRFLTEFPLQFPTDEQIESLIRSAEL